MAEQLENNILHQFNSGMHSDFSPLQQPQGTQRFALNTVNDQSTPAIQWLERESWNSSKNNERANELHASLPPGFIIIGSVYIGDGEFCVFSANPDSGVSRIGVMLEDGSWCKDSEISSPLLEFSIEHQIQGTYRLRRGCEKTVYWVDGLNPPRVITLGNRTYYFLNGDVDGEIIPNRFLLIREPDTIPTFRSVKVIDGGGDLPPGSYTISIQYLDADMNPTRWLNETDTLLIYNSLLSSDYRNITGSFGTYLDIPDNPLSMGNTNKHIEVELGTLDTTYPFYRLGISMATSGTGVVNRAMMTQVISTNNPTTVVSSLESLVETSVEDLIAHSALISSAGTIEQHENSLILGNTKGWQGNLCVLQEVASRITADCVVKTERLQFSPVQQGDMKSPTIHFDSIHFDTDGLGYMPGEIYSFGIVFVTERGFTSPVFHIPGKSPADGDRIYSGTIHDGLLPMSVNNQTSTRYPQQKTCEEQGFWKVDNNGDTLEDTNIRHHRFPKRDIDNPMVRVLPSGGVEETTKSLLLTVVNSNLVHPELNCTDESYIPGFPQSIELNISFRVNGTLRQEVVSVNPRVFYKECGEDSTESQYRIGLGVVGDDPNIEIVSATLNTFRPETTIVDMEEVTSWVSDIVNFGIDGITYEVTVNRGSAGRRDYEIKKFGIVFSNIDYSTVDLGIDDSIKGYYIVRNHRTENNKTVIDSGVLTPCTKSPSLQNALGFGEYIANSLLLPTRGRTNPLNSSTGVGMGVPNLHNDYWNLVTPRFLFEANPLVANTFNIERNGSFSNTSPGALHPTESSTRFSDVLEGSSLRVAGGGEDGRNFSSQNMDYFNENKSSPHNPGLDGWCFKMACRDNYVGFTPENPGELGGTIEHIHNLGGGEYSGSRQHVEKCVYNIQMERQAQIVEFEDGTGPSYDLDNPSIPYVYLTRGLVNPYSNFNNLPYYKDTINLQTGSTCRVFGGDTYISPLRYSLTGKYSNRIAALLPRGTTRWTNFWRGFAAVLLVIIAVAATIITWGGASFTIPLAVGAGVTLMALGGATWIIANGVRNHRWLENFERAFTDGLDGTCTDGWTDREYGFEDSNENRFHYRGRTHDGPSDDELQYYTDCLTDLWFESEVNISLRASSSSMDSFFGAPGNSEEGNINNEYIRTVTSGSGRGQQRRVWLMTRNWNIDSPAGQSRASADVGSRVASFRSPVTLLERFSNNKCLVTSLERNHGRAFIGLVMGEYLVENPDFKRRGHPTPFFGLPPEYDCCSDCRESFPHRFYWSAQSFQEELTDNYGVFKANDYKDIEGESGEIVNIFRMRNRLFIHTREGLWDQPKNYQERVTDEIVSFIGTGSMYDIAPRRIIESRTGQSAGTWHRESCIITPSGYFFVCEKERKMYVMGDEGLFPITDTGLQYWFKDNMEILWKESISECFEFNSLTGEYDKYECVVGLPDNPSNPNGTGYVATYDSYKDRVIITKRDKCPKGIHNNSWTISYDLVSRDWVSYHSYLPYFYMFTADRFYSASEQSLNLGDIWKHNIEGRFQSFYGKMYPFIMEWISKENPLLTSLTDSVRLIFSAREYNKDLEDWADSKHSFFNKLIAYNSRQCTGELNIIVKDKDISEDYLNNSIENLTLSDIIASNKENTWSLNNLRDIRVDYSTPIFRTDLESRQDDYYIDKVLNKESMCFNKYWEDLETLRDKYLVVRFILDTFADENNVEVALDFSIQNEKISER